MKQIKVEQGVGWGGGGNGGGDKNLPSTGLDESCMKGQSAYDDATGNNEVRALDNSHTLVLLFVVDL